MLPINHFKRALQSGRAQIGVWSTIPSPYVSELIAGAGYDWVLLDTEHTPTDVPLMLSQLQATAAAQPPEGMLPAHAVVRPAWNDPVLIKRYLDIGAQTLLLPFVQNAEEARAAVLATRYPSAGIPGIRGMGGSTRAANFGRTADYVARAAEELCVLVQVETAEALDQIEAIAAVDGIDGIFIGPADLSASLGYPGNAGHPAVSGAIDDAIRRIRACGKAPGILMVDEARARECLALGAQFVAVALDTVMLRNGLDAAAARFRNPGQASAAPAPGGY
ncbi:MULTISPECIES: HpcH/HpaI aldolase family protein [Cupriavidus]